MIPGITTAIVGFILLCIAFPHIVKHKSQFFIAFALVLAVMAIQAILDLFFTTNMVGFGRFLEFLCDVFEIGALLLLVVSCGGLTIGELGGEFSHAFEVMRRGETTKEVIIPLRGEQPGQGRREAEARRQQARNLDQEIDSTSIPPVPPRAAPPADSGSLPLE